MMKRICTLFLALLLLASLTACGSKEDKQPDTVNPPASDSANDATPPAGDKTDAPSTPSGPAPTPKADSKYVLSYQGCELPMNTDFAPLLAYLGEPASYFEAESCAFEGLDKTYTYSGFVITTRPDGDKDYVSSIVLTDDSVTTPEGVYIGSPAGDVTAAYGQGDTASDTLLGYVRGGTALNFILDGGKVISIEYLAE